MEGENMRTLERKRQGVNWENYRQALPVLTIALIFAFFMIILGIMQFVGGNG